ncbi:MAG: hypothetical protein KBE65_16855 [Phycisphaerae bacterium]|nr:hypothetical protein [Phycisphaerae bacterium]
MTAVATSRRATRYCCDSVIPALQWRDILFSRQDEPQEERGIEPKETKEGEK